MFPGRESVYIVLVSVLACKSLSLLPQYLLCAPIVVGFINTTFSGVEQGSAHSIAVGYQKGAAVARQNLVFNVQNTPGTASEFSIL